MKKQFSILCIGWALAAVVGAGGPGVETTRCAAQPPASDDGESGREYRDASGSLRPLSYWADQLSNDRYLRREAAKRHLIAGGQASVPILKQVLGQGNLETVESVIAILTQIAEAEEPWTTEGAADALQAVESNSIGSEASLAASALESVGESRKQMAQVRLRGDGLFVDEKTVALGSRSSERKVVLIDDQWNGDVRSLAWMRWLVDIEFAVVSGTAAIPEVFDAIAKMPNLKILVVRDCELSPECLAQLQDRLRLDTFELRYVRLNESLLAEISKLQLRSSLYLLGTGVSDERVEKLKVDLPGLDIDHRRGGFLGVVCRSADRDYCEVSEVVPGSGADDAGLRAGDIVIRIDGIKITRFDDLQRQINTHIPGEEISLRVLREGQPVDTVATLKKQETQ